MELSATSLAARERLVLPSRAQMRRRSGRHRVALILALLDSALNSREGPDGEAVTAPSMRTSHSSARDPARAQEARTRRDDWSVFPPIFISPLVKGGPRGNDIRRAPAPRDADRDGLHRSPVDLQPAAIKQLGSVLQSFLIILPEASKRILVSARPSRFSSRRSSRAASARSGRLVLGLVASLATASYSRLCSAAMPASREIVEGDDAHRLVVLFSVSYCSSRR